MGETDTGSGRKEYKDITFKTRTEDHSRMIQSFLSLIIGNFHEEHGPIIVKLNEAITNKHHNIARDTINSIVSLIEEYHANMKNLEEMVEEYIFLGSPESLPIRLKSGDIIKGQELGERIRQVQEETLAEKEKVKKRIAKRKSKKSSSEKSGK